MIKDETPKKLPSNISKIIPPKKTLLSAVTGALTNNQDSPKAKTQLVRTLLPSKAGKNAVCIKPKTIFIKSNTKSFLIF